MSKQIKSYPKWVQEKAIQRQVEQGNEPNYEVELDDDKKQGNFNWETTKEGFRIWLDASINNLQPLADFHGIKIDENGEEVVEDLIKAQKDYLEMTSRVFHSREAKQMKAWLFQGTNELKRPITIYIKAIDIEIAILEFETKYPQYSYWATKECEPIL